MQNDKTEGLTGWLNRYQGLERSEEQLVHTAATADAFCKAVETATRDVPFESEPSPFFALLHDLAPDELKK